MDFILHLYFGFIFTGTLHLQGDDISMRYKRFIFIYNTYITIESLKTSAIYNILLYRIISKIINNVNMENNI